MKLLNIFDILYNKTNRFRLLSYYGFYKWMDDETYLKKAFSMYMKRELDLNNPRTYNEKIQWLKLNDRRPEYSKMVDKYEAKRFIANIVGEEYIIPTLGVWEKFDDIEFDMLPDKFVLKTTHDSGGVVICKDKNKFNVSYAKKIINKSLRHNYFYYGREWAYKNVKPRIIAEQYMEDSKHKELRDYKFLTFNGVPRVMYITSECNTDKKVDYFDMNFNHLDLHDDDYNAVVPPEKPINFEVMKSMAQKLAKGIPTLRVDFYEMDGKLYVGELTFYYSNGHVPFEPAEWDQILGDWIELPLGEEKF